jgi:undecaprenyl-diphosphatase
MDMVNILKFLLLGIVQGVTEVLPISSSGHVEIVKKLIEIDCVNNIMFLIIVNTGSLLTFVFIYWKRLVQIISSFFIYIFKPAKRQDHKQGYIYTLKVLLATLPAVIVGFLFEDMIDSILQSHGLLLVGVGLLLTSTVLYYITSREPFDSKDNDLTWLDSILIGIAQSVALIPGVSRSGMTSSTALHRDKSIQTALDFSFILYIPVSFGSIVLMVIQLVRGDETLNGNLSIGLFVIAFFGALIATYIAYRLIFNIFKSGKLRYFSYYCFGASAFALLLYII